MDSMLMFYIAFSIHVWKRWNRINGSKMCIFFNVKKRDICDFVQLNKKKHDHNSYTIKLYVTNGSPQIGTMLIHM